MTQQEALQFLLSQGYDESEAQALLQTLPPSEIGGQGEVDPSALEAALLKDGKLKQSPFGGLEVPITPAKPPTQLIPDRIEDLAGTTAEPGEPEKEPVEGELTPLQSGLQKQASADPAVVASVTADEQAAIDQADPDARAEANELIAILEAGQEGARYDWVYQALEVGSLDSNEALIRFYEIYTKIEKPQEILTNEDEIVVKAKDILSRGAGNPFVQIAVTSFGQESGNYIPTQMWDNINVLEIQEMMDRYGITSSRAIEIGHVAQQYDLEPLELAELWDNQDIEKLVGGETVFGGVAAEKEDFRILQRGLTDTAQLFNTGLTLYDQSFMMASLHVQNPELAQRLRSDPYSLDALELREVLKAVGGGREGDPQVNWIQTRLAGGFRASAEVDKEAMRNAVQVLADGWNLTGTEGVVANLTAELVSQSIAAAEASLPNPFGPLARGVALTDVIQDRAAHVKRGLRETPEYKDLFQNLQGGESEEEFVRRFENRSQSILGDDVVGAVRNAMRTGNVNTIFQQGLNTPVGDSSTTFQEIIAKNAQVFRDML